MAGRSVTTVMNRNGFSLSLSPFVRFSILASYNETSTLLYSNFIGWKLRSFPTYTSNTAGRSANSWDSGWKSRRKKKRDGEGSEERSGNDKDKGGQEVSARLLRPFRESPGMRAMLYRVSLFVST